MCREKVHPGQPRRTLAEEFEAVQGDEILRLAMQVANDVIPFDAHRIFISWTDLSESLWHFGTGFLIGQEFDDGVERSRSFDEQLGSKDYVQFEEHNRQICLLRMRVQRGQGYLAIARERRKRHSAAPKSVANRFSKCEIRHLQQVGRLLSGALADSDACEVLRRLHLNFLDRRTLLQEATSDEILNEYLLKAAHLCHGLSPEAFDSTVQPDRGIVRLTAKLINDNGMALEIAACKSTNPSEWTDDQKRTPYPLPEANSNPDSITANVHLSGETHVSNQYDTDRIPTIRIFQDTKCHISAPIAAGRGRPIGVLSVRQLRRMLTTGL